MWSLPRLSEPAAVFMRRWSYRPGRVHTTLVVLPLGPAQDAIRLRRAHSWAVGTKPRLNPAAVGASPVSVGCQTKPLRCAHNAAEVRSLTPRTVKTCVRCAFTVFSLMVSLRAMLLLGRPTATSDRTSRPFRVLNAELR